MRIEDLSFNDIVATEMCINYTIEDLEKSGHPADILVASQLCFLRSYYRDIIDTMEKERKKNR